MTSLLRITLTAGLALGAVLLGGFTAHHCGERHDCAIRGGRTEVVNGMERCVVSLPRDRT